MRFISEQDAIDLIKDNDTLAVSSSIGWSVPEVLLAKLEEVYHKTKHPSNLTLSMGIVPGAFNYDNVGGNHLVEKGLVGKLITSHVGSSKKLEKCILNNQFPTYTIPLGVYGKLVRAISAGDIGYLTNIGLNTFADPRVSGCKANDVSDEKMVELVNIDGVEQLLYKSFPIDICFIKASCVDRCGNVSISDEVIKGEQKELAAATHNSNGIVVIEVNRIVKKIKTSEVAIHKSLVDYVVVAKSDNCYSREYSNYTLSKICHKKNKNFGVNDKLNSRKICARRAFLELECNDVVNLGVGVPEGVAVVAHEENFLDKLTLSIEMGPLGGIPLGGQAFGASLGAEAIMNSIYTMDLYDGGYLDVAILGLAEVDKIGNVNVSKFNGRIAGPGGFINISQSTKKIIFVGTFTSIGLKENIINNELVIDKEGKVKKFKETVDQITFSAKSAIDNKQDVLYVTERAVFKLTNDGLVLIEIAPGIDLDKDILNQMEFKPLVSEELSLMPGKIFSEGSMCVSNELNKLKIINNIRNSFKIKRKKLFIQKV